MYMNIFTGFSTCAALISHLRIVHGQQKEYICFFCSSHFTRKHSLNYHIYVHYDVTKFRCRHLDESGKICGRSERHPNHHKEHVAKKHHFCEECNIQFKDINEIDDHWRDEHARTGLVKRSNVKLEVKANFAFPEPEIEYSTENNRSFVGFGDIELNIDELNLLLDY